MAGMVGGLGGYGRNTQRPRKPPELCEFCKLENCEDSHESEAAPGFFLRHHRTVVEASTGKVHVRDLESEEPKSYCMDEPFKAATKFANDLKKVTCRICQKHLKDPDF